MEKKRKRVDDTSSVGCEAGLFDFLAEETFFDEERRGSDKEFDTDSSI
jgi:hypothetical protein